MLRDREHGAGGGRCIGAPIGIADPCAERGHNVSLEGAPGAPHRNGHNTLPSLAVRVPFPSRNGEKGCTTVEGVRHFCAHIYIFYRAHIATRCSRPCQAAQRTRTYAPLYARVTRTVCPGERRDAEIHGIEVTHGCGNGGRGAVVGGKKKTRGREEGRGEGNRNESSNTGGAKHVCAWRGRRGGTERLDFSDSEFCSSFFLPLSLSHAHPLITDSPYLPTCTTFSPAYHSFLRPRALSTTTPPSYATFSLDLPVSSALYNTARGLGRPNRWCRCRHNKNVEKAMANVHADGRERGEKEPRRSCIRLPLRWRDRGIAPVFRGVIHEAPDEIPRPRFLSSPPPFSLPAA